MPQYANICFIIMPFGEKEVVDSKGEKRKVNFDWIYDNVFVPAISQVPLPAPESGKLEAHRTDKDFFAGDISQEMFAYIEYSRIALTDITGLNANVFYELGVRHRAQQSGTVIFRQVDAPIPFDINNIKAFPYEYQPEEQAVESRKLITRVLTESLQQNRIDSPARKALIVQQALVKQEPDKSFVESDLRDAENAIRAQNKPAAIVAYQHALTGDPNNNLLCQRLGLLLKDEGRFPDALNEFTRAIEIAPGYAEAYREKGIAENKLYWKAKPEERGAMADGIASLRKAVELNPQDYDAHASLGGALKRAGKTEEALAEYQRATEVSNGHSYPLLNALKLKSQLAGKLDVDSKTQFLIKRAERSLRAQVATEPPYDPPWSLFDLAEIQLYNKNKDEFLSIAERGTEYCSHKWQVKTFADSLQALSDAGINQAGLKECIAMLRERQELLPD